MDDEILIPIIKYFKDKSQQPIQTPISTQEDYHTECMHDSPKIFKYPKGSEALCVVNILLLAS